MAAMHYLTVQDILWINLQVSKRVNHYNFARLEEATFYQYAYGESSSVEPQACRFLTGFLKMHPFDCANEATAFVGFLAFLRMNGHRFDVEDPACSPLLEDLGRSSGDSILGQIKVDHHSHHEATPDIRNVIRSVIECYPLTVAGLAKSAAA
jgi:prophage maintenance system killer protein